VENIRRVLRKFGGYAKNPGSPLRVWRSRGACGPRNRERPHAPGYWHVTCDGL